MTGRVLIQCEPGHAWHGWEFAILERQPGRITTQVGTFLLRGETWRHAAFLDGSVTCVLFEVGHGHEPAIFPTVTDHR